MQQTQRELETMSKINEIRKLDINQSDKYDEILSPMLKKTKYESTRGLPNGLFTQLTTIS